jgi:hypothetical protein
MGLSKTTTHSHQRSVVPLPLVGQREWVALPELGIGCMLARLDDRRTTSTLRVGEWRPVSLDGLPGMRFPIYPLAHDNRTFILADAPWVTSAEPSGPITVRIRIQLGPTRWLVDFVLERHDPDDTLALTLGGSALAGRFHLDPQRQEVAGPPSLVHHFG